MVGPHCVQLPEGIGPAPIVDQSIAREGSRTPDQDCARTLTGRQTKSKENKTKRWNLITSPKIAAPPCEPWPRVSFHRIPRCWIAGCSRRLLMAAGKIY